MEALLQVENLTKTFDSFTAVDRVSFALYPGECLGIIGESGSGKTTLVNMITRLTEPTSGTIRLEGQEISGLKGQALRDMYRKVQMVFQTPVESFDPRRTLGDGIAESLVNNGLRKRQALAEARQLLKQCGLPEEFADRYPHQVSGGQCQRAAIARAIAIKPKVLILDEATSALDNVTQDAVLNNILKMKSTVIMVAHRLSTVEGFDRIIMMEDGKIVEEGTFSALMELDGKFAQLVRKQIVK